MNDVARKVRVYEDCLQECDSVQFGTCRQQVPGKCWYRYNRHGNLGFRAVYMSVYSHEGIEGEQKYGSIHS